MSTFKELKDVIVKGGSDAFKISKDIVTNRKKKIADAIIDDVVNTLANDSKFIGIVAETIIRYTNEYKNKDITDIYYINYSLSKGDTVVSVDAEISHEVPHSGVIRIMSDGYTYRVTYTGIAYNKFVGCKNVPDAEVGDSVYVPFILDAEEFDPR